MPQVVALFCGRHRASSQAHYETACGLRKFLQRIVAEMGALLFRYFAYSERLILPQVVTV